MDLLKGDFNTAFKSLSPPDPFYVSPIDYRPSIDSNGNWFFEQHGKSFFYFTYSGCPDAQRAYEQCPPVNAIINRKAQAYINGKTWVLNDKGKEATGAVAAKLRKLIEQPNPLQSWEQFEAQGYIYQQLFGYNIVLPIKPAGFKDNIDATSLWNLPPTMVKVEETNKLFYQADVEGMIKEIVLSYKGAETKLKASDVHIMKDFTPSFHTLILPQSRIAALALPINNIIGAYESRNVLINYRGALGILSNDPGGGQYGSIPLSPEEKDGLQQEFRKYGLKNHQWQFIITSASLKWQQMGVSTRELMLFEEIQADTMAICDSYNYPYQLMSDAKGTTFSNLNEGKKLLYQDATIPEAQSMYGQWNKLFKTAEYGLKIDKDYSTIAVLQEDKVQAATARKTLDEALKVEFESGLITLDDWLEKLGEDPLPNNLGQVRATDPKSSNVPLAVTIGVGGVQGLIAVITAQGMSAEAKQATLEVVFGLSSDDAARMAQEGEQQNQNTNEGQGQETTEDQGGQEDS